MTAFTPEVTGTPRPRAFSTNSGSPVALVRTAWHHRDLIWQMTRREVLGRYRGSVLGLLWSFFSPLLMLTVYTFAFSYVFKMRVQGFPPTEAPPTAIFGVFAFTGLTLFTVMSESVARAPTLIQSNANLVKRVIFPLEILPFATLGSGLIHAGVSFGILVAAIVIMTGSLHLTAVAVPLVVLPLVLFVLGMAWFLASLGVYLRDVAHTIGIVLMVLMYLSPIFYQIEIIKDPIIRDLIRLNPVTIPVEQTREALLFGRWPDWPLVVVHGMASLLVACAGFWWFQRTKRGFADVL